MEDKLQMISEKLRHHPLIVELNYGETLNYEELISLKIWIDDEISKLEDKG
jgi:hypothetical protein